MMRRALGRPEHALPAFVLTLMVLGFVLAPAFGGSDLSSFSIFNLLQQLAWLGPLTLAFGLTMTAGEFDLSVPGVAALGGVLAVQTGDGSPYVGAAAAVGAGATIGLVQGVLISRLQISSVPVTLSTFIALFGATQWISGSEILSFDEPSVPMWLGETWWTVLSPAVLITLVLFVVVWLVMSGTTRGRDARAVGGDRRASRTAGVRVDGVLTSLFVLSGALAAAGGVLLAYGSASANPNVDLQPLVLGVVGALAGGATLRGGRGHVPGLLAGALSVCVLQAIFTTTALEEWMSQLIFAGLLVVVAALDAPDLFRAVVRARAARVPTGRA